MLWFLTAEKFPNRKSQEHLFLVNGCAVAADLQYIFSACCSRFLTVLLLADDIFQGPIPYLQVLGKADPAGRIRGSGHKWWTSNFIWTLLLLWDWLKQHLARVAERDKRYFPFLKILNTWWDAALGSGWLCLFPHQQCCDSVIKLWAAQKYHHSC